MGADRQHVTIGFVAFAIRGQHGRTGAGGLCANGNAQFVEESHVFQLAPATAAPGATLPVPESVSLALGTSDFLLAEGSPERAGGLPASILPCSSAPSSMATRSARISPLTRAVFQMWTRSAPSSLPSTRPRTTISRAMISAFTVALGPTVRMEF